MNIGKSIQLGKHGFGEMTATLTWLNKLPLVQWEARNYGKHACEIQFTFLGFVSGIMDSLICMSGPTLLQNNLTINNIEDIATSLKSREAPSMYIGNQIPFIFK